jgi:hypothetical protein
MVRYGRVWYGVENYGMAWQITALQGIVYGTVRMCKQIVPVNPQILGLIPLTQPASVLGVPVPDPDPHQHVTDPQHCSKEP